MQQEVVDLIQSIPRLDVPNAHDTISNVQTSTVVVDGQRFQMTTADRDLLENFGTPLAFETFGQALFPGSIVQGEILRRGLPAQIALPRAPGTIVLTDLTFGSGSPQFSRELADPQLGSVEQARQELITQQMSPNTPANINFSLFRFFSAEHALVQVAARAEWLTGEAQANLRQAASSTQSNIIASLLQAYYNIAFQAPIDGNAFSDAVTRSQAERFMGEGNPPLYVAQVTYGRRILFIASSSEDATALSVALSASFNAFTARGHVEVSVDQQNILRQTTITAIILGGPAGSAVQTLAQTEDKIPRLDQLLNDGSRFSPTSPGVPIAFQLNYLRDNLVALFSFAAGFRQQTRVEDPFKITQVLLRFLTDDDDKDDSLVAFVDVLGPDNRVLFHGEFGRGQTFHDHKATPDFNLPPFSLDLREPVPADRLNDMKLRIGINDNGDGWNTRYDLTAVRDDGAILAAGHSPKPRHELGDGNPVVFEDPFSA